MSKENHLDPTPETLANRRAGMEMLRDAALRNNTIALQTESMMALPDKLGLFIDNGDFSDDDDGWDDVRPY